MKNRHWVMIAAVALVTSLVFGASTASPALAADLNPSQIGSSCAPGETGTWHFVNNQTGGASAGILTATFGDAGVVVVGASSVNKNNQHFFIVGPAGPLQSASTNLPGRLVLSDLDCEGKKPPPPK